MSDGGSFRLESLPQTFTELTASIRSCAKLPQTRFMCVQVWRFPYYSIDFKGMMKQSEIDGNIYGMCLPQWLDEDHELITISSGIVARNSDSV